MGKPPPGLELHPPRRGNSKLALWERRAPRICKENSKGGGRGVGGGNYCVSLHLAVQGFAGRIL